jgi:competence protein ComEA
MKSSIRFVAAVLVAVLALAAVPTFAADAAAKVVNINSASAAELARLPRVGPSVAARILEYREKNGNFKKAEDLMLVRGIGEKTFELIQPYVALSGSTTLTDKVASPRAKKSETPAKGNG